MHLESCRSDDVSDVRLLKSRTSFQNTESLACAILVEGEGCWLHHKITVLPKESAPGVLNQKHDCV